MTTTLAWPTVRQRLEQAARYWLVTTRPDARAHVVPVDGLWVDDTAARRLADASKAKYGYAPAPDTYAAGVWSMRPQRAREWTNFPTNATRFTFG